MAGPYPYARFYLPLQYMADETGTPAVGWKLYFFVGTDDDTGGTTEPQDTYTSSTLSDVNTNPVVADGAGIFPPIFLDPALIYKVMLVREDGSEVWTANPVSAFNPEAIASERFVVSQIVVDGNGQVPNSGVCGDDFIPPACTLLYWVLQANEPGDLVLDVWAAPFVVNTPPNASNSITASAPPTLSSGVSQIDTTLAGWSKDLAAQTAIRYNIISAATLTRFTFTLVGSVP